MFIGITCACAPTAAKSYNHHFQHFGTLKTFILSRLSRTASTTKQSTASLLSRKGASQPGHYSDIGVYQGPERANRGQSKTIRTFIQSGKQHDVENDGIHLTFEMQNHFAQAEHLDHETLSSLEPVVTKL